jgi:class 3 adenylate cyclase
MEWTTFPPIKEAVVVAFDMRASSHIVETLTRSGELDHLIAFLSKLKQFVVSLQQVDKDFEIHKFTGDGWILLFPLPINGAKALGHLQALCAY